VKTIVKEDFLLPSFFERLQNIVNGNSINWQFENDTVYNANDNQMMFTHTLYNKLIKQESILKPIFEPILYFVDELIDIKDLLKMKMNLYVNHTIQHKQKKHIDIAKEDKKTAIDGLKTAVFNFTTCDGYTQVEDKKYPSKENSIIIFDGNKLHCGATPTNTKSRIVLNLNVI